MGEMPWILAVDVGDREYEAMRRAICQLTDPCALVERKDIDNAIETLDRYSHPALILTSYRNEMQTIRLLSLIGANGRLRHIRIWMLLHQCSMQSAELCRAFGATACFQVPVEQTTFESRLSGLLAVR